MVLLLVFLLPFLALVLIGLLPRLLLLLLLAVAVVFRLVNELLLEKDSLLLVKVKL